MHQRKVGDRSVGAVGLGAMHLSTRGDVPEDRAVATIHAARDAGVTRIDTADAYAPSADTVGHNERLVAKALRSWSGDRDAVLVATKGGHTRTPDGGWGLDGSATYLRRACEASLRALGVAAIGLYQHHRPDPTVPYEETVGTLKALRDEGKIQLVGLSNANAQQIAAAVEILGPGGLASVQNEASPRFRGSDPQLRLCDSLGVAFLPWSPLGGSGEAKEVGSRFTPFAEVADVHGVSPQQVVLAWLLARSAAVVPIPGATRPETIRDSVAAADLTLSAEEVRRLDATG